MTRRPSPGHPPAEVSSFVGRRDELAALRRSLSGFSTRTQIAAWYAAHPDG